MSRKQRVEDKLRRLIKRERVRDDVKDGEIAIVEIDGFHCAWYQDRSEEYPDIIDCTDSFENIGSQVHSFVDFMREKGTPVKRVLVRDEYGMYNESYLVKRGKSKKTQNGDF